MKNKRGLLFAIILSILMPIQMAFAVSSPAILAGQKRDKQKKAQKQKNGFWCGTSGVARTVDAESELLLGHETREAVFFKQSERFILATRQKR